VREWRPDPSTTSHGPIPQAHIHSGQKEQPPQLETTYLGAVDRQGNAFSSTPSDANFSSHIVPGLGIVCSTWGSRAYTDPEHPGAVGGGRRPRMSANPQMAVLPGKEVIAFGSPGNEVLGQAQVQVFLNRVVFGMDPQSALEQPRFASYSWPGSIVPHPYFPGRINLESRIPKAVGQALAAKGHKVEWWPERKWLAGSPCMIVHDLASDVRFAGADHRRTAYAIGW
jgi:gamma-glutamyltranspeptidase/glutathione hydrolase